MAGGTNGEVSAARGSDAARRAEGVAGWIAPAARAGYTAKGVVYGLVGILAIQHAAGGGGGTAGGKEAVRELASGPFGQVLVGLTGLGLAGYVAWRLVQAVADPEHRGEAGWKRLAMRAFYLASGLLYAGLALYALELLVGSGGSASAGSGDGSSDWTARLMRRPWGTALVIAVGVGIGARGALQFGKAYTASFADRIRSFDSGPTRRRWALVVSRVGLTARGVIFLIIGSAFVIAAARHDPSRAAGLEEALGSLADTPWLLGPVGAGLVAYAVYQWTKARYRMIGI